MTIDLLYSEAKCLAHAEPAWLALPEALRGERIDRSQPRPGVHPSRMADRAVLVASFNDATAAHRRGYRRIALLEHGVGQSYEGHTSRAYPGGPGRDIVSLFLSPNETAASRDRAAYPGVRVVVVGCPKLDTLPARDDSPGPVVAISFHWSQKSPPELRSALPHYLEALPALAERLTLIGHYHPMAARAVLPVYRRLGIEIVDSFEDVCRRADVYVADNTSTLYEFASTGRPVVVLNAPWYRRDVEHGLRFWVAAGVGIEVDAPDLLVAAVERALETANDPERRGWREAVLDIVYGRRKGASKRAAKALEAWVA